MKRSALRFIRTLIHSVLIAQLSLFASPASAGQTTELAVQQRRLNHALLAFIAHQFMVIRTPEQFKDMFLSGLGPEDQKEIFALIKPLKHMPTMHWNGAKLAVKDGSRKLVLEWPDPARFEFRINGFAFQYDQEQRLFPQIQAFERKMQGGRHALFSLILPEANAVDPVITPSMLVAIAVTAVVTTVITSLFSGPLGGISQAAFCKTVGGWLETKDCLELREKQRKAKLGNGAKFDAVKNQSGADKKNILAKFEGQDWECPSENDGKERRYRGRLRAHELQDKKLVPTGEWIEVVALLEPDGTPSDFIFLKSGSGDPAKIDTKSADGAKKLVVHVSFDTELDVAIDYRVPDPEYPKPLHSPTKKLDRTQSLDSSDVTKMDNADDMIRFLNYRNYKCVEEKVTADMIAGVEPASPAEPKKDPGTGK